MLAVRIHRHFLFMGHESFHTNFFNFTRRLVSRRRVRIAYANLLVKLAQCVFKVLVQKSDLFTECSKDVLMVQSISLEYSYVSCQFVKDLTRVSELCKEKHEVSDDIQNSKEIFRRLMNCCFASMVAWVDG